MRKLIDYVIGLYLFASAVFYLPGQNFDDSQKGLFIIIGMLFFALFLSIKPVRYAGNMWISGFLIYAIAVFLIRKDIQSISIVPLMNVFLTVMVYYVFVSYFQDTDIVYKVMQGVIVINLIFLVFQLLKIDPLLLDDMRRPNTHLVGLFGHPMNLGLWSSLVLPYVFSKSKLWACGVFMMLVLSQSYSSIGIGLFGVLLYLFFTHRKFFMKISIVVPVALAGLVYFMILKNMTTQAFVYDKVVLRYEINYPLLKASLSNPYFGFGLGTFKYVVAKAVNKDLIERIGMVDVTWNDYIGCMVEMGVVILFIFFGFFRQTFRRFISCVQDKEAIALFSSLATVPIGMMFHSYMNYFNVGIMCVMLFSVFTIITMRGVYEN